MIRPYLPSDAAATLTVFQRSVHGLGAKRYTQHQVDAWAPLDWTPHPEWAHARGRASTVVAEIDGAVVGFSDLLPDGLVDMLFVDPAAARIGVATALLRSVIGAASDRGIHSLTTHASLLARPVFEQMGFAVESEDAVQTRGELLAGYTMRRQAAKAGDLDETDALAAARDRFLPAEGVVAYLDGNSLGRPLKASRQRMLDFVDTQWAGRLIRGWDESWLELPQRLGDELGRVVLGAAPGQTLVADSTSVLLYKLVRAAVDARPGRTELVLSRDDFPTDRYILEGIAAERGLTLIWIPSGEVTTDAVAALVGPRTAAVVLSHVAYRSGFLVDAAAVTAVAHDAGALMLWDLSHSAGVVPIALDEWAVDLAVGCGYKYLNGGPGAPAFAYVRAGLQQQLRQPIQGWLGSRAPFEMGQGFDPADGIRRFASGTPPILAMLAMHDTVSLIAEFGLAAVRAKSVALTRFAIARSDELLADAALASPRNPDRRGSHITLDHDRFAEIMPGLWEQGVIPDFRRPNGIRLGLSPLSTSFGEVELGLLEIRAALHSEARPAG